MSTNRRLYTHFQLYSSQTTPCSSSWGRVGISFTHIAACTCVKMPVAIYVMWWNTRTLHHAQTMIQYTIPYMHSPSTEILWLRRSSEADVWTGHTAGHINLAAITTAVIQLLLCFLLPGNKLKYPGNLATQWRGCFRAASHYSLSPPTVSGLYTLICVNAMW